MKKTILLINLLIVAFLFLGILSVSEISAQTLIRPYAKVGYLMLAPSASDFGNIVVGNPSVSLDNELEVKKGNYGVGTQLLFPLSKSKGLRIGADVGFQSLYEWNMDLSKQPGGLPYGLTMDLTSWSETGIFITGLVELSPKSSGLFAQAGLGLQMVLGKSTHDIRSIYSEYNFTKENTYNSLELGLLLCGGYSIPVNNKISFPLMIRIDQIFEYGFNPMISASVGLSIKL